MHAYLFDGARTRRFAIAACGLCAMAAVNPPPNRTIERIRADGRIRLGYRVNARPFAYKNEGGQPAGYSIALCQKVADSVKSDLGLAQLTVDWVPMAMDDRFRAVQQGQVDLLCGADTQTLTRRSEVDFSIPVFPGGIGAMVRSDAPARLREVLAGHNQTFRPTWRATATQILQARAFSAVSGTTAATWLNERLREFKVIADVKPVDSYDAGVGKLLARESDVLFGERAILMDAARRTSAARDLTVIDRLFTYEPLAFALAKGDDDFRLLVDRALSRFYRSGQIGAVYTQAFGEPDESAVTFFRWSALPE